MAFTAEQVAALKTAIARGVRVVQMGNERIEYRSLEEMRVALRMMEAELNGTPATKLKVSFPDTGRGL